MLIANKNFVISSIIKLTFFLGLLIVQSCSKSQIGKELSKSFDMPPASSQATKVSKGSGKNNSLEVRNENNSLTDTNKINTYRASENELNPSEKTFDSAKNTRKKITLKRSSAPFTPLPYRITIKLSGTNPSAPAELVTKALRSAGLKFEVERIERVEKRSPGHQNLDRGLRR